MKSANGINLTMLCDFYELTMGNGYFADGMGERVCYFDMFFRNVPDQGGYAVAAGFDALDAVAFEGDDGDVVVLVGEVCGVLSDAGEDFVDASEGLVVDGGH